MRSGDDSEEGPFSRRKNKFIDDLSECENAVGVTIDVTTEEPWVVTSKYGNASFKLVMVTSGGSKAAVFKTSDDLIIEGGNEWQPALTKKVDTRDGIDYFECIAIIAGGDVTISAG
ncbi:hypothetical protein CS022_07685 [Veronia nyctiphanis]|uniref:Uncharacterized protein n=1 Tax=Veronia nyctiphanis TaxID=1278244 RepID=A0A4Q0YT32_9GAMM|nr:hypothetical protein [Veronia nyctiphanis]RXJ73855.1 hypothetical protein CS022_07685 [Veronia nyctiphanis]